MLKEKISGLYLEMEIPAALFQLVSQLLILKLQPIGQSLQRAMCQVRWNIRRRKDAP